MATERSKNPSAVADAPLDRKAVLEQALRQRILTMQLPPGATLDEASLSEEFGLSRPPVRELMRQMAGEGYIELEVNRAARVATMNFKSLRDFFLIAPMIFVTAAKLSAENATIAEVRELKRIQERFRKAIQDLDVDARVFCNAEFHLKIGEMAHNVYVLPSLRRLLIDQARIGKVFYNPKSSQMQEDLELAASQHDDMIRAIENGDGDTAGNIAREHLDLSRRNMAMYAAPEGLEVPAAG